MSSHSVRVRFAPAPTGMMHLGNIRAALLNALYAKKHNGTWVLRIEDTDPERNYDPEATHIIEDLNWLGLEYDEGPHANNSYGPYFQSKRTALYQEKLQQLIDSKQAYRCFCSEQELAQKRNRQRALKLPPRYDRTCLQKTDDIIKQLLEEQTPFVWRFKLNQNQKITITDLAHKQVTFDLKNFSDFPLTRQNGTVTFMFANCVDDIAMKMTHVFRGEDHLTNTACQAALYDAFNAPLPIFWHMPILCSTSGKKLSKRDFGFSLRDLRDAGFTPEAIVNYLAIIGGSYKDEIMSFNQLINTINLDNPHTTGHITYDVEKLTWVNRKWIERYTPEELIEKCLPFLKEAYPTHNFSNKSTLAPVLQIIKSEMNTLKDCADLIRFYLTAPTITHVDIDACIPKEHKQVIFSLIRESLAHIDDSNAFTSSLKTLAKQHHIPLKYIFWLVRLALTGKTSGPGIHELISVLGVHTTVERIQKNLS